MHRANSHPRKLQINKRRCPKLHWIPTSVSLRLGVHYSVLTVTRLAHFPVHSGVPSDNRETPNEAEYHHFSHCRPAVSGWKTCMTSNRCPHYTNFANTDLQQRECNLQRCLRFCSCKNGRPFSRHKINFAATKLTLALADLQTFAAKASCGGNPPRLLFCS